MENSSLAKIFWEMSELLELKEDNPFKIRAYQKAALTLENLPENIEDLIYRGEKIPGIGKKLTGKIEELMKTGKIAAHQKLLHAFPKGFLELIQISGLGPKGAVLLHQKLGIKNLADLEKAARAKKIRTLSGMGPKKEENILGGIEQYKNRKGRFTLSQALNSADTIIASLKPLKDIEKIVAAGSLRRAQETIGDIDILVTAKKFGKIMHTFVSLPDVQQILAQGSTKSSILLKSGMQADLRVIEPKSFGAALHYFTGSKTHNIRIREIAVKKKLKISEYGVYRNNRLLAGKTEEEVYRCVGLAYIPPELRENRGEIEAAQRQAQGKTPGLPKLLELGDIKGDLHLHTLATDGANTLEEMVSAARKIGYSYIAITDHSVSARIAGGLSETELIKQWKSIDKLNQKNKGAYILKGIEVDILPDGNLDFPDRLLKQSEVVIAAIHSNFKMEKDLMTRRIIKALQNKYVNILAHPTGRLLSQRAAYAVDLDKIVETAAETGTFIEINANPERLDLDDIHCKLAKERGVEIVINSDAHSAAGFGVMKFGVAVARRGWLTKNEVLNTLPRELLIDKLYSKRKS